MSSISLGSKIFTMPKISQKQIFIHCTVLSHTWLSLIRKQSMKSLGELLSRVWWCSWIFFIVNSLSFSVLANTLWCQPGSQSISRGKTLYNWDREENKRINTVWQKYPYFHKLYIIQHPPETKTNKWSLIISTITWSWFSLLHPPFKPHLQPTSSKLPARRECCQTLRYLRGFSEGWGSVHHRSWSADQRPNSRWHWKQSSSRKRWVQKVSLKEK